MSNYYTDYRKTQYEDIASDFSTGHIVKARYIKPCIQQDNELIMALPPVRSEEEYWKAFETTPLINPKDRLKTSEERKQLVEQLEMYRVAREFGYAIDFAVAEALRRGYRLSVKNAGNFTYDETSLRNGFYTKTVGNACGFTVIGSSGVGKTTALGASLFYYPQVIIHEYDNARMIQVPYIKVECPPAGSMKSFYDQCLDEFERILSYDIPGKKQCKTVDAKEQLFKKCSMRWNLGLLVIDEIQNLLKSRNNYLLMNQFLSLSNMLNVPIVYVGTNKIVDFFKSGEFFMQRRIGKEILISPYEKDDLWDNLMTQLWNFQWMQEHVPMTKEHSDAMYYESAGIIDRVIALFRIAQQEAIQLGLDTIHGFTPDFIRLVSKEVFSISKTNLNCLADKGVPDYKLRASDLVYPDKISDKLSNNMIDTKIQLSESKERLLEPKRVKEKQMFEEIERRVIVNVLSVFPQKYQIEEIKAAIGKCISNGKKRLSEEALTQAVLLILFNVKSSLKEKKTSSIKKELTKNQVIGMEFPRYQGVK